jgi:hypothetical protein
MKAEVKALESPGIPDLWDYKPDYNYDYATMDFKFRLEMFIGPVGSESSDLFTATVCGPSTVKGFVPGKDFLIEPYRDKSGHYLVMKQYNYDTLRAFLDDYVERCGGWWWGFIAWKIGKIAKWERRAKNIATKRRRR